MMKIFATACVGFAVLGTATALADDHADRQALMRANTAAVSALNSNIIGVLDPKFLKAQSQVLADNGAKIPALFAPGSDQADPGVKPAIWTDQAGFKAAAAKLAADAKKVPTGFPDRLAMVLAMKDVQADCTACHTTYRVMAAAPAGRGGRGRGAAPPPPPAADAGADAAK